MSTVVCNMCGGKFSGYLNNCPACGWAIPSVKTPTRTDAEYDALTRRIAQLEAEVARLQPLADLGVAVLEWRDAYHAVSLVDSIPYKTRVEEMADILRATQAKTK